MTGNWRPLGELLVEKGLITDVDLRAALDSQGESGLPLGEIVVGQGLVSVEDLAVVLLEQCGLDMSTQQGFGSGLREQLQRRAAVRTDVPQAAVEREPVAVVQPETEMVVDNDQVVVAELEPIAVADPEPVAFVEFEPEPGPEPARGPEATAASAELPVIEWVAVEPEPDEPPLEPVDRWEADDDPEDEAEPEPPAGPSAPALTVAPTKRGRRGLLRRHRDVDALERLQALVDAFEAEHRELQQNLHALRRLLREEAA